jgi:hypothetical protein
VYVGRHNTKIGKPEAEFFFGILENKQHGFSPHIALKNPLFVIGPGRHVIRRPINEFPFFPHERTSVPDMVRKRRFASVPDAFFCKKSKFGAWHLCGIRCLALTSCRRRPAVLWTAWGSNPQGFIFCLDFSEN